MRVVILAGGLGTRFSEETEHRPKPMIQIDDKPILWHIMNIYAKQGIMDFVIATGYKSEVIESWVESLKSTWKISCINTGLQTQTGGRIKKCLNELGTGPVFMTYGDGLGNVNLRKLLDIHRRNRKIATVTAVRPPARFGHLNIEDEIVTRFGEKNQLDVGWINGGFFILEHDVIEYIVDPMEAFETGAMTRLTKLGKLAAHKHNGFWLPMDTKSERDTLSKLANEPEQPWLKDLPIDSFS